jgi:hypothetical protein
MAVRTILCLVFIVSAEAGRDGIRGSRPVLAAQRVRLGGGFVSGRLSQSLAEGVYFSFELKYALLSIDEELLGALELCDPILQSLPGLPPSGDVRQDVDEAHQLTSFEHNGVGGGPEPTVIPAPDRRLALEGLEGELGRTLVDVV